jgi:RHS repeat-associated protein
MPVAVEQVTGKERDAETGLDYFGARYFSSAQGRFTSPDPKQFTARHLSYPKKWNRYAYVQSNPLAMVDTDGEDDFCVFRPTATATSRAWAAVQAEAPRPGNNVVIYNRQDASNPRFLAAVHTEGAHVIDTGHTVETNEGSAAAVLLGNNGAVGNPNIVGSTLPKDGMPGLPVIAPNVQASTVAVFGCNSNDLAGQYSNTTFTGTSPTSNTAAEDTGALRYAQTLVRGGTVGQATAAAQSGMATTTNQANANPNRVMNYQSPTVTTTTPAGRQTVCSTGADGRQNCQS